MEKLPVNAASYISRRECSVQLLVSSEMCPVITLELFSTLKNHVQNFCIGYMFVNKLAGYKNLPISDSNAIFTVINFQKTFL